MKYKLPELSYAYNALEPNISEEQLKIHHDIHHAGYVKKANAILEGIHESKDMKSTLKSLSFNIAGHLLHSLFWENLTPDETKPLGKILEILQKEFGSIENFKKEFSEAAASVEGSGWAALTFCEMTQRPIIMQIEKHNVNVIPMFNILLVVDVWEHAYYLDYKNKRAEFLERFWNIVNWNEVNNRLK